jgi:hypothetical protein
MHMRTVQNCLVSVDVHEKKTRQSEEKEQTSLTINWHSRQTNLILCWRVDKDYLFKSKSQPKTILIHLDFD